MPSGDKYNSWKQMEINLLIPLLKIVKIGRLKQSSTFLRFLPFIWRMSWLRPIPKAMGMIWEARKNDFLNSYLNRRPKWKKLCSRWLRDYMGNWECMSLKNNSVAQMLDWIKTIKINDRESIFCKMIFKSLWF